MNPGSEPLGRRRFLRLAAAGAAALTGSSVAALSSCDPTTGPGNGEGTRSPLAVQRLKQSNRLHAVAHHGIASGFALGMTVDPRL
jgi:hypothetical protein